MCVPLSLKFGNCSGYVGHLSILMMKYQDNNNIINNDERLSELSLGGQIKGLIQKAVLLDISYCEEVPVSGALTTGSLDPDPTTGGAF